MARASDAVHHTETSWFAVLLTSRFVTHWFPRHCGNGRVLVDPTRLALQPGVLPLVCRANGGIGEVVTLGMEMASGQFAISPGYQPRHPGGHCGIRAVEVPQ
jgi:hypothetical protein